MQLQLMASSNATMPVFSHSTAQHRDEMLGQPRRRIDEAKLALAG